MFDNFNNIDFYEKQKVRKWWIWGIVLSINLISIYALYFQLIIGKPFGTNPLSDLSLIIISCLSGLFLLFTFSIKLETKINYEGVFVRFFPFHKNFKLYKWNEISNIYVRKYSPIKEFGGWGLRYNFYRTNKAYNISGNYGLQIDFLNNKKLLIGTKQSEILLEILT